MGRHSDLNGAEGFLRQVEGIQKVLKALVDGRQKRFLHYYAPRTGKTFVQAAMAYWVLKLSFLDSLEVQNFNQSSSDCTETLTQQVFLGTASWNYM